MRLNKAADRTMSVLGLLLFGTLTGCSGNSDTESVRLMVWSPSVRTGA